MQIKFLSKKWTTTRFNFTSSVNLYFVKWCTFILHVSIYLWTSIPFSELYALHVPLHSFLYYFKQRLLLFETQWPLPLLEITFFLPSSEYHNWSFVKIYFPLEGKMGSGVGLGKAAAPIHQIIQLTLGIWIFNIL